ncbi:MAG: restriction endonuclease [Actinobacteria bacterium]|jgi:restriction system protein|nr:restriction endonuclease [Actinomycetota bacterium]
MAIPKFNELFDDVLAELSSGEVLHRRELRQRVVDRMKLTDSERSETMEGGGNRAGSRVHWAFEFLCQAGAVSRPKRGYAKITEFGRELMKEQGGVTLERLRETEGFHEWRKRTLANRERRKSERSDGIEQSESTGGTPLEQIENGVNEIRASVASQLLQRLREEDPEFLERTVLTLLHAMGYGSSEDDLQHLGGSGDGGVDGVIRQDKFGLDQIYIQAKRYGSNVIGRPHIQSFVGALSGKHATRGVFITTSEFSSEAEEFARNVPQYRIILIDGENLAQLMIEHKVGVSVSRTLEIVEIDENFFIDE